MFVLDASVAASWAFEDEISPYSDRILGMLDHDTALVPAIWPLEIANAIHGAQRRGHIEAADTARFTGLIPILRIQIDRLRLDQAFTSVLDLAREHHLSVYDASYLELAMREGLALATQDRRLREAAETSGVKIA
jgi:predicted nucleic acid-binding protein